MVFLKIHKLPEPRPSHSRLSAQTLGPDCAPMRGRFLLPYSETYRKVMLFGVALVGNSARFATAPPLEDAFDGRVLRARFEEGRKLADREHPACAASRAITNYLPS